MKFPRTKENSPQKKQNSNSNRTQPKLIKKVFTNKIIIKNPQQNEIPYTKRLARQIDILYTKKPTKERKISHPHQKNPADRTPQHCHPDPQENEEYKSKDGKEGEDEHEEDKEDESEDEEGEDEDEEDDDDSLSGVVGSRSSTLLSPTYIPVLPIPLIVVGAPPLEVLLVSLI